MENSVNENLTALFRGYSAGQVTNQDQDHNVSILLFSSRHDDHNAPIPVGIIYAGKVDPDQIVVSTTNSDEKYLLYYKGFGIYFSTWRRLAT